MRKNIEELEQKIGYKFQDKNLLKKAMLHSSYAMKSSSRKVNVMRDWNF